MADNIFESSFKDIVDSRILSEIFKDFEHVLCPHTGGHGIEGGEEPPGPLNRLSIGYGPDGHGLSAKFLGIDEIKSKHGLPINYSKLHVKECKAAISSFFKSSHLVSLDISGENALEVELDAVHPFELKVERGFIDMDVDEDSGSSGSITPTNNGVNGSSPDIDFVPGGGPVQNISVHTYGQPTTVDLQTTGEKPVNALLFTVTPLRKGKLIQVNIMLHKTGLPRMPIPVRGISQNASALELAMHLYPYTFPLHRMQLSYKDRYLHAVDILSQSKIRNGSNLDLYILDDLHMHGINGFNALGASIDRNRANNHLPHPKRILDRKNALKFHMKLLNPAPFMPPSHPAPVPNRPEPLRERRSHDLSVLRACRDNQPPDTIDQTTDFDETQTPAQAAHIAGGADSDAASSTSSKRVSRHNLFRRVCARTFGRNRDTTMTPRGRPLLPIYKSSRSRTPTPHPRKFTSVKLEDGSDVEVDVHENPGSSSSQETVRGSDYVSESSVEVLDRETTTDDHVLHQAMDATTIEDQISRQHDMLEAALNSTGPEESEWVMR